MTVSPRPIALVDDSVGLVPAGETYGVGDAQTVWAPADLLRQQWSDRVQLTHGWRTLIDRAQSGAETRRQRAARPSLLAVVAAQTHDEEDVAALRASLVRWGHSLTLAPLWCEHVRTTSFVGEFVEDQELPCVTADRMFFVGQRVAALLPYTAADGGSRARGRFVQIFTIVSIQPTKLIVAEPLDSTAIGAPFVLPAGSRIVPLFEAEPVAVADLEAVTGRIVRGAFGFRSAASQLLASALPGWADWDTAPAGAATYDGLPVFDLWPEWSHVLVGSLRETRRTAVGSGAVVHLGGDRAATTLECGFKLQRRVDAVRLRAWHAGRRGRTLPLWVVEPVRNMRPSIGLASIGGATTVDLEPTKYNKALAPMASRRDRLAIVQVVGGVRTPVIRRIVSVAEVTVSGQKRERYTLDAALPAIPVGEIDRIGFAVRCRFEDDEHTENWTTTEHCESVVRFTETLHEGAVEVGVPSLAEALVCDCMSDEEEACSGSPLRDAPLLTPTPGSAEALASSPDGFVLASAGAHFHTKGSIRCVVYAGAFGCPTKISKYFNVEWDCEIPVSPSDLAELNVVNVLIPAVVAVEAAYSACTGPTMPPAGTAIVLRASVLWQYSAGQRLLGLSIRGRSDAADAIDNWLLEFSVKQDGSGTAGGFATASVFLSPLFGVDWDAQVTQPVGLTAVAATASRKSNDIDLDAAFSVHLCPVYEQ